MLGLIGMAWKYRSLIGIVVSAVKAFKAIRDDAKTPGEEKLADYKIADYIREVKETLDLIRDIEDRKLRRDLRREYRTVRRHVKKVGSLEAFDVLQEKIQELKSKAKEAQ